MLKVRLPLLSDHALRHILKKSSSLTEINEIREIIENVLIKKGLFFPKNSSFYYKNRYCNQDNFNVLICGGLFERNFSKVVRSVIQFDVKSFETTNYLPRMTEWRSSAFKAVCVKGNIYVFGGFNQDADQILHVEKYSSTNKTWKKVAVMPDSLYMYTACAFMDKIFIIGGINRQPCIDIDTNSCTQLDTNDGNWKEVNGMNEARGDPACAVFQGRLVVSGGYSKTSGYLNTVEAYDVFANEWSPMANMNERTDDHKMVVVGDKLFVIPHGTYSCDVFDNASKKFVALRCPFEFFRYCRVVAIGETIYVFDRNSSIYCYDVNENKWSVESCGATENILGFSCVKLHSY